MRRRLLFLWLDLVLGPLHRFAARRYMWRTAYNLYVARVNALRAIQGLDRRRAADLDFEEATW